MKRAHFLPLAPLVLLAACQSQSLTVSPPHDTQQIPAVAVNDPCSAYTTADTCQEGGSRGVTFNVSFGPHPSTCAWMPVDACPAGATCPSNVCVTKGPCSSLTTAAACQANGACAWSAIETTATAPALCPVGTDCGSGGFCFVRESSSGCLCVQPLACPANGACPPVQCDCPAPQPVDAGSGGGGICSCACPACAPGEACPPCDCQCGGGGTGGSGGGCGTVTGTGGASGAGGGGGTGTCTCNCPECPAGEACPACSCSCTNGSTTTMTVPSSGGAVGSDPTTTGTGGSGSAPVSVCGCPACPANTACAPCGCGTSPPADPCSAYTDAKSCVADTADECGWTSLGIACVTTPCPSGVCAKMQPGATGDAGSVGTGCGCACPACSAGETCPPCSCNCCPSSPPSRPVGITQISVDAGSTTPNTGPTPL